MAKKDRSMSHSKDLTILEKVDMIFNEETTKVCVAVQRRPEGQHCPHCNTDDDQYEFKHPIMSNRGRKCVCKPMFSITTGTAMEGPKIKLCLWAAGINQFFQELKRVSSMRLHCEPAITGKASRFTMRRRRTAYDRRVGPFSGPVEDDGTFVGGIKKAKHNSKKLSARPAPFGKTALVGIKEHESNKVAAQIVPEIKAATLQGFEEGQTELEAQVYTDDGISNVGISRKHESVNHGAGQYSRDRPHTNGTDFFWAVPNRAHEGTFHKFGVKHPQWHVDAFSGRQNVRKGDKIRQMLGVVSGMIGKCPQYGDPTSDYNPTSGARS